MFSFLWADQLLVGLFACCRQHCPSIRDEIGKKPRRGFPVVGTCANDQISRERTTASYNSEDCGNFHIQKANGSRVSSLRPQVRSLFLETLKPVKFQKSDVYITIARFSNSCWRTGNAHPAISTRPAASRAAVGETPYPRPIRNTLSNSAAS